MGCRLFGTWLCPVWLLISPEYGEQREGYVVAHPVIARRLKMKSVIPPRFLLVLCERVVGNMRLQIKGMATPGPRLVRSVWKGRREKGGAVGKDSQVGRFIGADKMVDLVPGSVEPVELNSAFGDGEGEYFAVLGEDELPQPLESLECLVGRDGSCDVTDYMGLVMVLSF